MRPLAACSCTAPHRTSFPCAAFAPQVGSALDELLSSRAAAEAANLPADKRTLFRMDGIRVRCTALCCAALHYAVTCCAVACCAVVGLQP